MHPSALTAAVPTIHEIILADIDEWDEFVSENEDAIIEQYGSVEEAWRCADRGDLRMGGGAAPIFHVHFAVPR